MIIKILLPRDRIDLNIKVYLRADFFIFQIDSRLTNGQMKRMAKFKVNGQILDFFEMANGHGHSPTLKIQDQRMAVAIHQKSKTGVGEWPWPFIMFENSDTYV